MARNELRCAESHNVGHAIYQRPGSGGAAKYLGFSVMRRTPLPLVTYTHFSLAPSAIDMREPENGVKVAACDGPSAAPHKPVPAIRTVSPLAVSIANSEHNAFAATIR